MQPFFIMKKIIIVVGVILLSACSPLDKSIAAFRRAVALCDENDVKLVVMLNADSTRQTVAINCKLLDK